MAEQMNASEFSEFIVRANRRGLSVNPVHFKNDMRVGNPMPITSHEHRVYMMAEAPVETEGLSAGLVYGVFDPNSEDGEHLFWNKALSYNDAYRVAELYFTLEDQS